MKIVNYCLFILLSTILCTNSLFSQQVISTQGRSLTGEGGSISFTIGETLTGTKVTDDGIITQGFHQTRLTVTAIDGPAVEPLDVNVWPNPSKEIVYVLIDYYDPDQISFVLYDVQGRILSRLAGSSNLTEIKLPGGTPGIYFLKITMGNKNIGTYRIIIQN
jgi:hypothetical protein